MKHTQNTQAHLEHLLQVALGRRPVAAAAAAAAWRPILRQDALAGGRQLSDRGATFEERLHLLHCEWVIPGCCVCVYVCVFMCVYWSYVQMVGTEFSGIEISQG